MGLIRLVGLYLSCALCMPAFSQSQPDCHAPAASGYFPEHVQGRPAVVVFVHGVLGDPVKTWLSSPTFAANVFWPCLVAQHPAFVQTNLYLARYTTTLDRAPSIEEAAAALYEELRGEGVLREHSHVAFVAHSLGGL